jgi:hypothetical protein
MKKTIYKREDWKLHLKSWRTKLKIILTNNLLQTLSEDGFGDWYTKKTEPAAIFVWDEEEPDDYRIYITKRASPGDISHECLHAAGRILYDCGVVYTIDNDEPFTYLTQYLVDYIYDKLNNFKPMETIFWMEEQSDGRYRFFATVTDLDNQKNPYELSDDKLEGLITKVKDVLSRRLKPTKRKNNG